MRAGAHALNLLSVPLNVHVLTALEDEVLPLIELRRRIGSPPQTTMRGHMRTLTQLGILERRRELGFPGSVDYGLGPAGRDLIAVARVLEGWLAVSPDGPLEPGTPAAKSSIKALTDGWSSAMIRALAARPLSLTELSRVISGLNYPALERRLAAMRLAGQIRHCGEGGRSRPYTATSWLRRSIAPLAAAARWERRHDPGAASPISRIDIESTFLLTIPTLQLPPDTAGACRLAVEIGRNGDRTLAGVLVRVEEGRVVSCVSKLQGQADAWAVGSSSAWLEAVIDREPDRLELGGDSTLLLTLLDRLSGSLFAVPQRA